MKITIISHSYLEPENNKNIVAFEKIATMQVVSPATTMDWRVSGNHLLFSRNALPCYFKTIPFFYVHKSQCVLLTIDMGLIRFKPDIIIVEYNPWSIMFIQAFMCKMIFCPRARLVCMIKKNTLLEPAGFRGKFRKWVTNRTLAMTDHIIAASRMVSKLLTNKFGITEHKIHVIHHLGVDTDLFRPCQSHHSKNLIIIGYCGRFESEKGIMDLIEAVNMVRQDPNLSIPIYMKVLGTGTLRPDLEAMQSNMPWLEIYPPVRISETSNFLRKLDIFVLPSRITEDHQEHDAHALLEAMSVGISCIGCRSGIIPEILDDGAGILVDPESPKEMADSITYLIANDGVRKELGELARKKAKREFSLDAIALQKYKVFCSLLEK